MGIELRPYRTNDAYFYTIRPIARQMGMRGWGGEAKGAQVTVRRRNTIRRFITEIAYMEAYRRNRNHGIVWAR